MPLRVDRFNDFLQAMTGIPDLIEEHDNMPERWHCAISDQWYTNDAAVILVDPSSN